MSNPTRRAEMTQQLLVRLFVSLEDFAIARFCALTLLKNNWHHAFFETRRKFTTYQKQVAFTTAMIVSYSRPFKTDGGGVSLPKKLWPLAGREAALHDKILKLRNTTYAHSDTSLRNVRLAQAKGGVFVVANFRPLALSKEEVESLLLLIERVCQNIRERTEEIRVGKV